MGNKNEFRKQQLIKLKNWWKQNQVVPSTLYQNLFAAPYFQTAQTIAITVSMATELPTQPIIQRALQLGKSIYIPKTYSNYSMDFFNLQAQKSISRTAFGVWEPEEIDPLNSVGADLTIVPALAVALDTKQRIGFGAGYYDRYLAQHPQTQSVVLALPPIVFQHADWEIDVLDYPVNHVITESRLI
ncbi:5-formyltetrahydrofolate cyclo-ligase [Bombilactobacillus bombi]|uniref:5-formyltetrahydrofolate cyclo-ligase n=1 Tax=Bombilactobacillus bombi TaxID=1303590 RepID=A0A3R6ZAB5_9LACO|nr:5-formyltetrahydrofolate cyclo-ligase [Bombilactobacillus bombi]RHW48354.1 5-formyltetrahydrofolate cyclo-ligase [Bombilactobacillus bombi]